MPQLLHIYTKSVLNMALAPGSVGGKNIICAVILWSYYIYHWYIMEKQTKTVLK